MKEENSADVMVTSERFHREPETDPKRFSSPASGYELKGNEIITSKGDWDSHV